MSSGICSKPAGLYASNYEIKIRKNKEIAMAVTHSTLSFPSHKVVESLKLGNVCTSLAGKVEIPVNDTIMILYRFPWFSN